MLPPSGIMDEGRNANKRLANAKKKLQEYKNQKKLETSSTSSGSPGQSPVKLDEEEVTVRSETCNGQAVQLDLSNQSLTESMMSVSSESQANIPSETPSVSAVQGEPERRVLDLESPVEMTPAELPVSTTTMNVVEVNPIQTDAPPAAVAVAEPVVKDTTENSTQCEEEDKQETHYVIEALEKDVSVLKKENEGLRRRESELVQQLETSEKLIRDLRKEVNQFKQHGNVHQQLEELQSAMVVVSKSKMDIAEELSNEQDKNKELLANLGTYETELQSLRNENSKLWTEINALKTRLEEEVMKNQVLEDQRRHFSVQVETLQAKLNSMEKYSVSEKTVEHHHSSSASRNTSEDHSHHSHNDCSGDHHHHHHDDGHHHDHPHDHDHQHDHHTHNGHDSHSDHHHHDDHSEHSHSHSHSNHTSMSSESRKLIEMEKTLKRLEWENKTYETELMKLAPLKSLEPQCEELRERNKALKEEVDRLEHLVIQLQGENDTIGDYIHLYQTQKLALRQHAKENAQLVEALSKEKDELLQKLSELSHAVEKLAGQPHGEVLETRIRDLIEDVNTKVHEPYTCSVCSGSRLMTV